MGLEALLDINLTSKSILIPMCLDKLWMKALYMLSSWRVGTTLLPAQGYPDYSQEELADNSTCCLQHHHH